jgi:hypothetical protein
VTIVPPAAADKCSGTTSSAPTGPRARGDGRLRALAADGRRARRGGRLEASPLAAAVTTASALLGVASLGYQGQLIEIDLTAALDS